MTMQTLSATLLISTLMLVGVGCTPVDDAVDATVRTPLTALEDTVQLTADERARQRRERDMLLNELPIAFIVTEGADVPAGIVVEEGVIGCNDRVAFAPVTRDDASDEIVSDALKTLFATKDSNVAGLYNSVWQSSLSVDDVRSSDGVTTEVYLTGQTQMGGVCDTPRFMAQIERTISQYRPTYKVFLNGTEANWRCLADMSGECK